MLGDRQQFCSRRSPCFNILDDRICGPEEDLTNSVRAFLIPSLDMVIGRRIIFRHLIQSPTAETQVTERFESHICLFYRLLVGNHLEEQEAFCSLVFCKRISI